MSAIDGVAQAVVDKAQRKVDNLMLGAVVWSIALGALNTILLVAVLLVVIL
jgi:hypothetical protein